MTSGRGRKERKEGPVSLVQKIVYTLWNFFRKKLRRAETIAKKKICLYGVPQSGLRCQNLLCALHKQ